MLDLEARFSPRIIPASTEYPYGELKPNTSTGSNDGTPVTAALGNDIEGFKQAVITRANIDPSGSPDTATNSQLLDALDKRYLEIDYQTWTFATGGLLTNCSQAVKYTDNKWYSWSGIFPVGGKVVTAGTDPTAVTGYVPRTDVVLRGELSEIDGANLVGGATYAQIRAYSGTATKIHCSGRLNIFDGAHGDFELDASDTSSADNDATTLVDANGGRWKRKYSGNVKAEWAGVIPGSSYVHAELTNLIEHFGSAEFRPGMYKLNATVSIDNKSFVFLCSGARDVFFDFYNGGDHFVFKCHDGGYCDFSDISNCCIRNMSGLAANALTVSGRVGSQQPVTSFTSDKIAINGYTVDGSKGLVLDGIETSTISRPYVQADIPIFIGGLSGTGVDRSTIENFYLYSTNGKKAIGVLAQVSDVVFDKGICTGGDGCAYISPDSSTPTALTFRNVRNEQPISTGAWAFDIVNCANLITLEDCSAGGCNGVRAVNSKHVSIKDSFLGFNYGTATLSLSAYSFTNCEYARVDGVRGDAHTTCSITSMSAKGTLRKASASTLIVSGEWTNDTVGSWSYSDVNGVSMLTYKVNVPLGPLSHRLPIDSPISGAVEITASFKSTTTSQVECVSAVISEGGTGVIGASANSGVFTTSIASKIGLLYQAGSGVYLMNNTSLVFDTCITIRKI